MVSKECANTAPWVCGQLGVPSSPQAPPGSTTIMNSDCQYPHRMARDSPAKAHYHTKDGSNNFYWKHIFHPDIEKTIPTHKESKRENSYKNSHYCPVNSKPIACKNHGQEIQAHEAKYRTLEEASIHVETLAAPAVRPSLVDPSPERAVHKRDWRCA
jgi:hypothetical protein